jgi:transketolase
MPPSFERLKGSDIKKKQLSSEDLFSARKRLLLMHFESGVGHIGGNLSSLDAMMMVFHEFKREIDDFILSKGHSAGALYITLWSLGLLQDEDLKDFHKDNTLLPGHPPAKGLPDIRFATGSLGHGLSLAAGLALAARLQGQDLHVYCLTSDGEWQEGSTWEAFMFACHHKLSNLTILVDRNGLQGFGSTKDIASMDRMIDRVSGFPCNPVVVDGHNLEDLRLALTTPSVGCPKFICMETIKGSGVSFMEDKMEWHYLPMNLDQYMQAVQDLESS